MNAPLPSWIVRLLGVETEAGEGATWHLEQSWAWPSWLKLVVVTLLAALVVGTYLRENRRASRGFRLALAAIRLAACGVLLLMLAQVTLVVQPTSLPYVVVIVDDSLSMAHADRYDDALRRSLADRVAGRASTASIAGVWPARSWPKMTARCSPSCSIATSCGSIT